MVGGEGFDEVDHARLVEVVRRLVENEELCGGIGEEQAGHGHSEALAAGQGSHGTEGIVTSDQHPCELGAHCGLGRLGTGLED